MMNALWRILRFRLGSEPLDALASQWSCILGGLGIGGLAIVTLREHAASRIEFLLGTTAAVLACLLLFLLGVLARQVHLTVREGRVPWRSRRWELLSHGAGVAVLGLGGWAFTSVSPGIAGLVTGALLVLGTYASILCLGCWSTVAHSLRSSRTAEPAAPSDRGGT
jgi:hypothetical protein